MERPLTVSQLARATGVPAKTIRYYEQIGVLPAPRRDEAGFVGCSRCGVHGAMAATSPSPARTARCASICRGHPPRRAQGGCHGFAVRLG